MTMFSPKSAVFDLSRDQHGEHGSQKRRSTPLMPMNLNSSNVPPVPSVLSPPPTPLSPPPRPDRLSLRLKSNSGLKGHTNEAALSKYTDYKIHRACQAPNSFVPKVDADGASYRSTSRCSRRNSGLTPIGLTSCLPFLDFLGKDTFQMAMDSPSVVRHLMKYCEKHCCEENIEFLLKIREYAHATNEMAGVLTSISTTYTALGATSPLNLPPMLSRPLNADVKRIAHSVLPNLESVFFEARSHIENRIATDIFPGFVKSQLAHCTSQVLANVGTPGASSKLEYPGLGESFCLTDTLATDNSILSVSDGFTSLTGYPIADIPGQNCNFLQGPFSDPEGIRRIQVAVRDRRETVELILNHRKDGEPFWNLLFLFPLKDSQGTVQYWLGAQINVSESIGSRKDMLRMLNGGSFPESPESVGTSQSMEQLSSRESVQDKKSDNRNGLHGRHGSKSFTSRKSLFHNFLKSPIQSPTSPPVPPLSKSAEYFPTPTLPPDYSHSKRSQSRFQTQRFQPRNQVQIYPTAYSHYIVLRYIRQDSTPGLASVGRRHAPNLIVAYYSDAAVDLLSIRSDISHVDIFHVLAERANSISASKSLKAAVREKLEQGKSITTELLLDRSRTLLGKRRSSSVGFAGRPSMSELDEARRDVRHSDDRGGEKSRKDKCAKQERLMSHWTPLKDAGGNVDWVVLILTQGQQ